MDGLRNLFIESEPLLVFVVIGLGYLAGQIKILGFKLGIAAVLFVGLFFGAWRPEGAPPLIIAPEIAELGLIIFVYIVGLSSGPGFFASFQKRGVRLNISITLGLFLGAIITFIVGWFLHLPAGQSAGVYAGGLTNTPSLAGLTEFIKNSGAGSIHDPPVGYTIAYPFGVIGGILICYLFFRIYRTQNLKEDSISDMGEDVAHTVVVKNFEVTNPELFGKPIGALRVRDKTGVTISRVRQGSSVIVPTKYTVLNKGDIVVTVGTPGAVKKARDFFGAETTEHPEFSTNIDSRRFVVSRRELVGKKIGELELDQKFNAQITRIRRVDVEIIPKPDMAIEIGDRLMVVMPVDKIKEVTEFFGDSLRGVSEPDYTAMTLGMSLGVLLGMTPIPIPGGNYIRLGFAGGPLIVGLILGRRGRTGPFLWSMSMESSQALRYIGLLLFLAGTGVRAGSEFFRSLSMTGAQIFLLGVITTTLTSLITLILLRYYARATIAQSIGATAGMQTQVATIVSIDEIARRNESFIAYATVYPVSMIGKILFAQLLYIVAYNIL